MNDRLISGDYQSVAKAVQKLSSNISQVERQSDLIGGLSDTQSFRKELTRKIQSISHSVIQIKNKLENAKDDESRSDIKWGKLDNQFLKQWDRLKAVTDKIRENFKSKPVQKESNKSTTKNNAKTRLLDNNNKTNSYNDQQQQQQQQPQQPPQQ
eukprot:529679_1